MPEAPPDYVTRVLARCQNEAILAVDQEQQAILRRLAAVGLGRSGQALREIAEAFLKTLATAATKMANFLFEAGVDPATAGDLLNGTLGSLKRSLSDHLLVILKRHAPTDRAVAAAGNIFEQGAEKTIVSAVDDLRHGMLEGRKMTKVNPPQGWIVNTIIGSPGAVQHVGAGNVTTNVTSNTVSEIRSALRDFVSSKEVTKLEREDREDLARVADKLDAELLISSPDESRIRSWGRTLKRLAEQLGVGVAGSALWSLLAGLPK